MAYLASPLTSSDAPSVLAGVMHTALLSEGYTLEDTVAIGTRTHKVYKSAAANNTEGIDWYLDLAYATTGTAGQLYVGAFGTYDSVTHTGGFGPWVMYDNDASSQNVYNATYHSRYGNTKYSLETNWTHIVGSATGSGSYYPLGLIASEPTPMAYWMSITPDRVIAMTTTAGDRVVYCGLYKPHPSWKAKTLAVAPQAYYPLITGQMDATLSPNVGWTMALASTPPAHPGLSPSSYHTKFDQKHVYPTVSSSSGNGLSGDIATGQASAVLDNSTPKGSRIGLYEARPAASGGAVEAAPGYESHPWGELYDMAIFGGSGVLRGDTLTVDGDPWVLTTTSGTRTIGFKRA